MKTAQRRSREPFRRRAESRELKTLRRKHPDVDPEWFAGLKPRTQRMLLSAWELKGVL